MKTLLVALAATIASPGAAHAASFLNGSFETGVNPRKFKTIFAGDTTSILGWTVGGNGVDYIGTYWTASQGSRSIDLSASGAGNISQTFDTVLGQAYRVTFDLGGNGAGPPVMKRMGVEATGNTVQAYSALRSAVPNIVYTPQVYLFKATGISTTLTFRGTDNGAYGAALDNVRVAAVPEPATWGMMVLGIGMLGFSLRRARTATLITAGCA